GQSLGGYIAQHIYFAAPERVHAMIIIGSTPIAKAYSKVEIWILKASLPLFQFWPYDHFAKTVAKNTAQTLLAQDYALQAIRQVERDDFLAVWKAVTLAIDARGRPELSIDVPLLLVHGDDDRTGSIKRDMPIWAAQEKNVTYQVIPNARHNANQDNPDFTNQVIVEFLRQNVG
ncbi:MAG: alpha/beta hydrolase, partial [Cyanobacteria bacterium J06636_16]